MILLTPSTLLTSFNIDSPSGPAIKAVIGLPICLAAVIADKDEGEILVPEDSMNARVSNLLKEDPKHLLNNIEVILSR